MPQKLHEDTNIACMVSDIKACLWAHVHHAQIVHGTGYSRLHAEEQEFSEARERLKRMCSKGLACGLMYIMRALYMA